MASETQLRLLEKYVLCGDRDGVVRLQTEWEKLSSDDETIHAVVQISLDIIDAEYLRALSIPHVAEFFSPCPNSNPSAIVSGRVKLHMEKGPEQLARQLLLVFAGYAALCVFVQQNTTGPSIAGLDASAIRTLFFGESVSDPSASLKKELSVDGESTREHVDCLDYLRVSEIILVHSKTLFAQCLLLPWLQARCLFQHQRALIDISSSLYTALCGSFEKCLITAKEHYKDDRTLLTKLLLEYGHAKSWYREVIFAKKIFDEAVEISGLQVNLTGMFGKRTKHQTFEVAQLVVQASRKDDSFARDEDPSSAPKEVPLDDYEILDSMKITNPTESTESSLHPLDQSLLLALWTVTVWIHFVSFDVRNSSPHNGLTTEQMTPYVDRVLKSPNNWLVYSTALLLRSRLDKEKGRTVERGAMQLQALVDQYDDEKPSAKERMEYVFCLNYPTRTELKEELGNRYLSLGVVMSALQIFEPLKMWDEVITCYIVAQKKAKALEIVNHQIQMNRTPQLLCILGDLTEDEKYYQEAWELSGCRFSRAMRSLGKMALKKEDWPTTIECYEKAVAINALHPAIWFSLGCAYMRINDGQNALRAFTRVAQQQPDDGECWSNMASIHISAGRKIEAYNALCEAIKYNYDSWKIWQNFSYVCMDTGHFYEAMLAVDRLLELKGDKCIDIQILQLLSKIVVENIKDHEDINGEKYVKQFRELMGHITSKITNNAEIWDIYAWLCQGLGETSKAVEYRKRQMRALQKAGWEQDKELFACVVLGAEKLVEICIDNNTDISSTKFTVRGLVKKSQLYFEGTAMHQKLQELCENITQADKK